MKSAYDFQLPFAYFCVVIPYASPPTTRPPNKKLKIGREGGRGRERERERERERDRERESRYSY